MSRGSPPISSAPQVIHVFVNLGLDQVIVGKVAFVRYARTPLLSEVIETAEWFLPSKSPGVMFLIIKEITTLIRQTSLEDLSNSPDID